MTDSWKIAVGQFPRQLSPFFAFGSTPEMRRIKALYRFGADILVSSLSPALVPEPRRPMMRVPIARIPSFDRVQ
jgi:hypothetical protein